MNEKKLKKYLLSKPLTKEDFPFGPETPVYKIHNKMFALLIWRQEQYNLNLKCDPQQAFILRDIFSAVTPGYHMNKKHWNTIIFDGSIPNGEIERMIDHSYGLVVKGLLKKQRRALEIEFGPERLYCD